MCDQLFACFTVYFVFKALVTQKKIIVIYEFIYLIFLRKKKVEH